MSAPQAAKLEEDSDVDDDNDDVGTINYLYKSKP